METSLPAMRLNNGESIPVVGLGTWNNSGNSGEVLQAVKDAIDVGYRHFDGAYIYMNEKEVGQAIRDKIEEGVIMRQDVFITSKLWNFFNAPDQVEGCCRKSLEDLGLDYIDLYLMHWPFGWKVENGKLVDTNVDYVDTWKAMENLVEMGLVKAIGVSNIDKEQLERLVFSASILPAACQVECHPYLNQQELVEYCKTQGIVFTAFSPFGSPTRPWADSNEPKLLEDPILMEIGEQYDKTAGQVILRWLMQRNVVTIPKSVRKARMAENLNIFDFELSQDDMELINGMNRNWKACKLANCKQAIEESFNTSSDIQANVSITIPTIKFNNGREIPAIGLGTWNEHSTLAEVTQAIKDAIDAGFRHIDAAYIYMNEAAIGQAIREKIEEGEITREDIFVTSKLWITFHRPELVSIGAQKSLNDLGLEYFDLFLINWPMAGQDKNGGWIEIDVHFVDTWKAMEELVEMGLAKSIGVSNFNMQQLERLLASATITPVINQIECHPYLNQELLVEYCASKNIAVGAFCPFGSPSRPWADPNEPKLLEDPQIISIGKKYSKTAAQVILRWQTQRGLVVTPKTVTKKRMTENLNIFDFQLTSEEMETMFSLNRNFRADPFPQVQDYKEYPFETQLHSQTSTEFVGWLLFVVGSHARKG